MTITVRLEPQTEARLAAEARTQGIPLEVYVETIIAKAAKAGAGSELSQAEFDAGLDALAEGSEELPILPPSAYRRESIYGDD